MITKEDFFKNKIKSSGLGCGGKYGYFQYNTENFKSELYYNYLYGWGLRIYFEDNPDVSIIFEEGSDDAQSVIDSLNACIPFINKIKNEEGYPKGFILADFTEETKDHYKYEDPERNISITINYNGANYCEANIFIGKISGKGVSVFFEQDNTDHILETINRCILTVQEIYNAIKDLKIGDEND